MVIWPLENCVRKHAIVFFILFCLSLPGCRNETSGHRLNRKSLVLRHMPTLSQIDVLSPFTVGNGDFACTADVTGLQTLADFYENGIPLTTLSNWGWHSIPNVEGYHAEHTWEYVNTYGRDVPYASIMNSAAAHYLRANPHRLHLGRIGFKRLSPELADYQSSDIRDIDQVMDIWHGLVKSSFTLAGHPMTVETCAHPEIDQIAVHVASPSLADAHLAIGFEFPYGSLDWGKTAADWNNPSRHTSTIIARGEHNVTLKRQLDATVYYVTIHWRGYADFKQVEQHVFVLVIKSEKQFDFTCQFSPVLKKQKDNATITFDKAKKHWHHFWQTGGAVDLSHSADPRSAELERRIILSQYLTAIQCSGSLPPQETGLTANSWYGKYHLEMHWWHAVHFVLWGRPLLLEKSLFWYKSILPAARAKAELQGYAGVRWPKMTSPDGFDSPSRVGVFLIWQQPHPIYYAELLYRHYRDNRILEQYKDIVFETADFMASFVHWDAPANRYVLGPPLIPAQEIYPPNETKNPAFELAYWSFGLKTAQRWRERLGLDRQEKWDHIIQNLADLPTNNGLYQNAETALNTFTDDFNRNDHPTLLGAYGMLPNDHIDIEMMRRTVLQVKTSWNWQRTWGWDYPLVAMTAARVGRPDIAVDALLMDTQKNTYLNNGHNYQSDRLPLYLPGNGGLLAAIAMMAAGWDGAPEVHAPGFPHDGSWTVHFEGLGRMP